MKFEVSEPWLEWNSSVYNPRDQFDAYCSALNDSHLKWSLNNTTPAHYLSKMRMRHLGGIRLVNCNCEPCFGARTASDIRMSDGEYFGLLYIYEGAEIVSHEDKTVEMKSNSFMIWDSTKRIEFKLLSDIKKLTLLIPQDRMRAQFPQIDQHIGKCIGCGSGLNAVVASHIAALGGEMNAIRYGIGDSAIDLSLELITTCLQSTDTHPVSKARQDLYDATIRFIHENLDHTELGPTLIAKSFHISTRYLHLLYAENEMSVSNLILNKRLEQCRRQLVHFGNAKDNITNIAFQWGFNDSSHFSKVFKKKYGVTPKEYRERHFAV